MSRISEQSNVLSACIDEAPTSIDIVRILHAVDRQLFDGFEQYHALPGPETTRAVEALVGVATSHRKVAVVMSGAGTSGRLAFFAARRFAALYATQPALADRVSFHYLMAGGDKGLIEAQEHSEDNVQLAKDDWSAMSAELADRSLIVLIGITCGLSAPYVAAQLDHTMDDERVVKVLLGFNPVALARNTVIESWHKSFFDVATDMATRGSAAAEQPRHFVINPVVGPEAITGSTRMKGGSATKMLLDLVATRLFAALQQSTADEHTDDDGDDNNNSVDKLLHRFGALLTPVYEQLAAMSAVFESAAVSLHTKAHVYYVGCDSLGILGLIDASECPPTFGAQFDDIRGFVNGGWHAMRNKAGDLTQLAETRDKAQYRIGAAHFLTDVAPFLTTNDTVVILRKVDDNDEANDEWGALQSVLNAVCSSHAKERSYLVSFVLDNHPKTVVPHVKPSNQLFVSLASFGLLQPHQSSADVALLELAAKWLLNALSTSAWVRRGKVYANRMIDLGISNNKLYFRAQVIVREILCNRADIADSDIRNAVLRGIYAVDESGNIREIDVASVCDNSVSTHVEAAFRSKAHGVKIVPTAVLLASGLCSSVQECCSMLESTVLRKLVQSAQAQK